MFYCVGRIPLEHHKIDVKDLNRGRIVTKVSLPVFYQPLGVTRQCLGNYFVAYIRDGNVLNSQCMETSPNWMFEMKETIQDIPFSRVCLWYSKYASGYLWFIYIRHPCGINQTYFVIRQWFRAPTTPARSNNSKDTLLTTLRIGIQSTKKRIFGINLWWEYDSWTSEFTCMMIKRQALSTDQEIFKSYKSFLSK